MKLLLALVLISLGAACAHLTLNLLAHEEMHCAEYGIPREKWVYEYTHDAPKICRQKTGLVFVEACAEKWGDGRGGYECRIFISPYYKPGGSPWLN